jgi:acyl-CoA hydrolase
MQPPSHNAEVLAAIADPDFQTELAQYNIELNVSAASRCPATPRSSSRATCASR